jgi:hypothetical protein
MASSKVKQAIERLNVSTSGLSAVRVANSLRSGDHVSAPRPEKPSPLAPGRPQSEPNR